METQISGRLTAHSNVTEDLKTGRSTGRFFGCTLGRSVFSLLLAAVLVLSDALPIPGGLPDTVKADNYPKKGTITFYKYTRLTNINDVAKKDDSYDYFFMAYEYGGSYYAPYTRILDTDNWPVMKVSEIMPHFNTSGGDFQSRTQIRHKKVNPKSGYYGSNGIGLWTQYNGIGEAGDWNKNGINASYTHDKIIPSDFTRYFNVRQSGSGENAKFQIIYVYGLNDSPADHTRFAANDKQIWGSLNYGAMPFMFYKIDSFTYTCINSNYTIGENQVYVADRDLFLREGVKLTIPEGSVLCVKNGPFYVNGEIECYGTILVEDGGIIMPYESTDAGSRIVMKEGGAMIIRKGGKVYAGCPKGSLWTSGDNGWLDMYAGSSIINFGLLIAGQCNFKYGQATLENHKGGAMFLGYTVDNTDENHFVNASVNADLIQRTIAGQTDVRYYFGAGKTNGQVHYGEGTNQTVIKTWDGALTMFANKNGSSGKTVKSYSYDKDGKSTVKTDFSPN
ncbi:MAG: hypothetical protein IJU80_10205 [Lachnospiraceae bacterium]|nr:hypothetical protein [Lachnospiraceae bacterium]